MQLSENEASSPIPRSKRRIVRWRKLRRSFYFAFSGIFFLLRTQQNARIEVALALVAIAGGLYVGLTSVEWAIIALTIALVLILEGLNTAVEAAVDLAMPHHHPLAKSAKDLAAGMVLIASIASVVIGTLLVFWPLAKALGLHL